MMHKMQNKIESSDTKFPEDVRKLNKSFQELKFDLAITKSVNSQLHNRFVIMERQCWASAQYSRRKYAGIVGLPTSVPDNELEETFCKFVDKVGVEINDRDIESCHLVGNQGRMIVKFSHRKECQQSMKVKKFDRSKFDGSRSR